MLIASYNNILLLWSMISRMIRQISENFPKITLMSIGTSLVINKPLKINELCQAPHT